MVNQDTLTGPSFSVRNRLARLAWGLIYNLFFRFSPKPLHSWRSFLLRSFGARVGRGVHVYPGVKIWAPWNLDLSDGCGIGSGAILYSQGMIRIGRRSVLSQGVNICTGTHDYTKPGMPLVTRGITIGANVWLATDVFVHPGVTIGDGCVIGARAVVVKDMPEWTICAGHPCKPLKPRQKV
ncbi:putative colanic acid biosynthesis acetyltransferase [Mucilaginibacter sp.]|uniref:putative colanic acid biosynthesis acetyltransferase n=1 Tax=Mucilaginibacter sp. TaxID=1882438 RepID=UPI0035BBDC2F